MRCVRSVHPRVCGEQAARAKAGNCLTGSSPRVRGTAVPRGGLGAVGRFIPACAGNRAARHFRPRARPVHPRVCGEQTNPVTTGLYPSWFIPACAGNRDSWYGTTLLKTVHPRVCGEQISPLASSSDKNGSSPRVRGTGAPRPHRVQHRRFIPACAGNSPRPTCQRCGYSVHPRVCGEQALRSCHGSHRIRFIPACAGNSINASPLGCLLTVHPRVCGEQTPEGDNNGETDGSSPRVRGTAAHFLKEPLLIRFIPACAGNRGLVVRRVPGGGGSSPRVRGTGTSMRPTHP